MVTHYKPTWRPNGFVAQEVAANVHSIFVNNRWEYGFGDNKEIPSVNRLADTIASLIHTVETNPRCVRTLQEDGISTVESGRFKVVREQEEGLKPRIAVYLQMYLDQPELEYE